MSWNDGGLCRITAGDLVALALIPLATAVSVTAI